MHHEASIAARRQSRSRRRKIRLSLYQHHGSWWIYSCDDGRQVRRLVASDKRTAEQIAAETNVQMAASAPTAFSFLPATAAELQAEFIDYHETVLRSSLATVRRYRSQAWHYSLLSGGFDSAASTFTKNNPFIPKRPLQGLKRRRSGLCSYHRELPPQRHPTTGKDTLGMCHGMFQVLW